MRLLLSALLLVLTTGQDEDGERNLRRKGDGGDVACGTEPKRVPAGDMGIRFNKISFANAVIPPEAEDGLPMMPEDFPLCPRK